MTFRFPSLAASCLLLLLCSGIDGYCQQLPSYTIGIVTDGPILNNPETVSLFKQEISSIAEEEFTVSFPDSLIRQADNTVAGVNRELDYLLDNEETDLILALGTVASAEALKRTDPVKPVIAALVFDADLLNAPLENGGSGVATLTYLDIQRPLGKEIELFHKLVPFQSLGLLIDERDIQGIPEINSLVRDLANEYTINVHLIPVGISADNALAGIPSGTDAVLVGPLWRLSGDEFKLLTQGLIDRKLPSFTMWDREYVEQGVFAGNLPPDLLEHIARRVAITVQDVLSGEDTATLSVAFSRGERLAINMATARAIDVYPSLAFMVGADLLNEERNDISRRLNLAQAVHEALQANLDLAIAERQVTAGAYSVNEARSVLLPQIGIGTGGRVIDDDRARLSGGSNPEQAWLGNATASQLIYSDKGWAGYRVEQFRQAGRGYDRDSVRLDIIFESSVAYLDVLRKKSIEHLQKDNLKLTQANLERAQIRLNTGVAGPDELYRWETKYAAERQEVLRAESNTLDAMQNMNRILQRPLFEEFVAEEADLKDPLLMGGDRLFFHLMSAPGHFRDFARFSIAKGLEVSPELKRIDSGIEAQQRIITASRRSFWLPTFSIEGEVDQYFSDGGEGQRNEGATGLDDTDWVLGVFATLPLVEGGRKYAELKRNREELQRLQLTRRATEERISQGILAAVNTIRASYPAIMLSRDAAEAARKNLQLITDSYVQGIKSIIDLLDAQNEYLAAELDGANAVYNFLIDQMGLQRAMGVFVTFMPEEQKNLWQEELKTLLQ